MATSQFPVFSSEFARLAKGENIFTQTGDMSDETWGEINPVNFKKKNRNPKAQKKYIKLLPRGRAETTFLYNLEGNYPPVSSAFV